MGKTFRTALVSIAAIVVLFFAYKLLFIRTVNYEIGGIKIPSKYNILTGKVTPILNYKGKEIKKAVQDRKANNIGLSGDEVTLAQFRWAIFEQWVKARPAYKDWDSNPAIFKKANEDFRKEMDASGTRIQVVK